MHWYAKVLNIGWLLIALMAWVPQGVAQIELGDDVKMNLNGTLGFGYGGSYGTFGQSSHSINLNGNGILAGSYHDPNFLSFNVQPYYNRSQANADTQSLFDESGVIASANIFSGSRFPGFVSFGRNFNGSGEFGIPGVSGLTTQGSGKTFSIGWSALLPNLPTLSVTYMTSGNTSSVLGANGDIHSATSLFNLNSTYRLAGFDLTGSYTRQHLDLTTPAFLGADNSAAESSSSSSTYGILASHLLPLSGNFSVGWNRTAFDNGSHIGSSNGATNTTDAMVTLNPTSRLNLFGEVRYTSNLAGALRQSLGNAGGAPVTIIGGAESHSFGTSAFANFNVGRGFMLRGRVSHQSQFFNGRNADFTQYGGTVSYNYSRPLFGLLYFSFGMVDNAQETGNNGLSFTGNVGLQRRFGGWETAVDFAYAQNVQTLVATFTTNSINYGGYARRRISPSTFWSGSYRAAQSGLLQDRSSTSHSNFVSSTLGWHRYTFTGNYSKAHGRTILTASGFLNPAPLPGVTGDELVLFNGSSYSIGVGASPLRRMALTINYTSATSDTRSSVKSSFNETQRYYSRLDYNLRKVVLRAGYTRAHQGISASGIPPTTVNTYFFGISRWFNVF
jgi:hypothetical protein